MDIERIVGELRAERDRLDGIITALEQLAGVDDGSAAPKRRGRKYMDKQGRQEVSERMKRYWEKRRSSRNEPKTEHAESAAAAADSGDGDPSSQAAQVNAA